MKSQFCRLHSGLRIHYLQAGQQNKEPLILLHGYPTSADLWRHCLAELGQHYWVIAPDIPGFGKSDKPGEASYDLDYFVGFVLDLLKTLRIESCHFAVHDLGAMVGLAVAARHPQLVQKLVVMNTAPYQQWSLASRLVIGLIRIRWVAKKMLWPRLFQMTMRATSYNKDRMSLSVTEIYRRHWIRDSAAKYAFWKTVLPSPQQLVEPVENVRRITVPTLVLWGDRDPLFPEKIARQLAMDIKGAQLQMIEDSGHFVSEERPKEVTRQLLAFLQ